MDLQCKTWGGSSSEFGKLIIPETSFSSNNKIITCIDSGMCSSSSIENSKYYRYHEYIYDNCYFYDYTITQFYININAIGKNAGNNIYKDYSKVKFIVENAVYLNRDHGIETYRSYITNSIYNTTYLAFRVYNAAITSASVSRLYKVQIYIKEDS